VLRHAIALSALLVTTAATAQVSGSVALVSDYRFRGISLSDERPAAQVAVAYDGRGGWYAGALASSVRPSGDVRMQLLAYLGVARPLRPGLDWEVGTEYATVAGPAHYAYPEAYLGLASARASVRLYYARHYFGQPTATYYLALERSWRLSDRLRLVGHLGLLRRNGPSGEESDRYRADARAGLGFTWRDVQLQLAWTVTRGSEGPYPFGYRAGHPAERQAWVLGISRSW
jgi:uncharacterized protein (TIGR02001 family)